MKQKQKPTTAEKQVHIESVKGSPQYTSWSLWWNGFLEKTGFDHGVKMQGSDR